MPTPPTKLLHEIDQHCKQLEHGINAISGITAIDDDPFGKDSLSNKARELVAHTLNDLNLRFSLSLREILDAMQYHLIQTLKTIKEMQEDELVKIDINALLPYKTFLRYMDGKYDMKELQEFINSYVMVEMVLKGLQDFYNPNRTDANRTTKEKVIQQLVIAIGQLTILEHELN